MYRDTHISICAIKMQVWYVHTHMLSLYAHLLPTVYVYEFNMILPLYLLSLGTPLASKLKNEIHI